MKIISWVTFIRYSFVCGSKIIAFMVSFKNPDLARHLYRVNPKFFVLRLYNTCFCLYDVTGRCAVHFNVQVLYD